MVDDKVVKLNENASQAVGVDNFATPVDFGVDLGNNESVASSFIASLEARRRELEQELAEVKSALDAAKSVRASRMGANASGASIEGPKAYVYELVKMHPGIRPRDISDQAKRDGRTKAANFPYKQLSVLAGEGKIEKRGEGYFSS